MDQLDMMFNELVNGTSEKDFTESVNGDVRKFRKFIQQACQATYALARYAHGVEMDGHMISIEVTIQSIIITLVEMNL